MFTAPVFTAFIGMAAGDPGILRLHERGQHLARLVIDRVETFQTEAAQGLLNALARKHRVSPYHLALSVRGLCHTHCPTTALVDECAFCQRRGNIMCTEKTTNGQGAGDGG